MESREANEVVQIKRGEASSAAADRLHPAWVNLIRFCREMGYGELERIKIQDGLPVIAEVTTRKVKFT